MARVHVSTWFLPCLILTLFLLIHPSFAFGAGNIASTAKIEGQNWRHGDIEDTLLQLLITRMGSKKFSKLDVKRVYFGNWLRDYSQAVDVGTVKYVSAEAIRILLWILGFMSFGFGTKEFEVTTDRLGCYRPEEHIDNPKDYADNIDARQYDRRLRGPIDERRELSVDERNGLKNYIASEDLGIVTSAGHVRNLLRRCIDLARRSKRGGGNDDFYEALRLLGTATHCMEDYTAHSNYVELCLLEMGERNVFPHVGRRTQIRLRGARDSVFPIVTGTFGGVDFLHSVMGELSDKTTQSEIQELEGAIDNSQNQNNVSMIKNLLNQLPSGLFGGEDQAGKVDQLQANAAAAQMQNIHITPKEPEQFTRQVLLIQKQIYPVIEFHDQVMKGITETIERIPILPDLIEQLQEQISIFVFSLIAPFILPLIRQVKEELATGSSEIINSSREKQHIVFNDDNSSDPTHSMLSKDHFSNILNEPAGKCASQILKWTIPQIVECWDDERADVDRTINRIIHGVFHHPALRDAGDDGARDGRQLMFRVVEQWWREQSPREQDDLRDKLSREGVRNGRNHKEGVHDSGHGCAGPLKMPGQGSGKSSGPNIIAGALGSLTGGSSQYGGQQNQMTAGLGKAAGEAVGGGLLGNLVGGVVGGVGSSLLGETFSGSNTKHNTYQQSGYNQDGSFTSSVIETAHQPSGYGGRQERYGQAEYQRTEYQSGGQREEYKRYEQDGRQGNTGYGFEQRVETQPRRDGGYQRTEERRIEQSGGHWESERRTEQYSQSGDRYSSETKHYSGSHGRKDDSDDDDDDEKKERKRREKEEKERRKREGGYRKDDSDDDKPKYGRRKSDSDDDKPKYGRRRDSEERREKRSSGHSYGNRRNDSDDDERREKRHSGGYRQQGESTYDGGRNEYGSSSQKYGYESQRQEQGYGGSSGYRQEESSYERRQEYGSGREEHSYGGSSGYGRQEESYGQSSGGFGGRQGGGYGREEQQEEMPGGFGDEGEEYGRGNRRSKGRYDEGGGYGGGGYNNY